jgi:aspartyl/asparaginyl beta-hydroxylase (cupin superfamily)
MQLKERAESVTQAAAEALRAGRPDEARRQVEAALGAGIVTGTLCLILALACRGLRDAAREEAALDRLLVIEPRAVRGLIMKGDCRARAGDDRTAVTFYRTALRIGPGKSHSPEVLAELQRAQSEVTRLETAYASQVEAALASRGFPPGQRSPRFQQSLDIIAGRKQVFLQEPTVFFFPGLPQIQFYDTAGLDWVPQVEEAAGAIRREIAALMAKGTEGFRPYIEAEPNRPRADDNQLLGKKDWSALFLCENGQPADDVIAQCPASWAAVQAAPLPRIEGSAPTIMFSLLRPRARIAPHTGVQNTRLVCHLPLIVPPGCGFRVGNEIRQWEEGKLLIFDDTIEHEAWNDSGEDRLVLIFDIWRPELSERERQEVSALFAA